MPQFHSSFPTCSIHICPVWIECVPPCPRPTTHIWGSSRLPISPQVHMSKPARGLSMHYQGGKTNKLYSTLLSQEIKHPAPALIPAEGSLLFGQLLASTMRCIILHNWWHFPQITLFCKLKNLSKVKQTYYVLLISCTVHQFLIKWSLVFWIMTGIAYGVAD